MYKRQALVAQANAAGGRDNITVVLFRLEDASGQGADGAAATQVGLPALKSEDVQRALAETPAPPATASSAGSAAPRRDPLPPRAGVPARRRRLPRPGFGTALIVAILVTVLAGGYLASQAVYFVGPSDDGFVTLYRGVPVELPGGLGLYQEVYVSGVSDAQLTARQRATISEQRLRSREDADDYLRQLERGSVGA